MKENITKRKHDRRCTSSRSQGACIFNDNFVEYGPLSSNYIRFAYNHFVCSITATLLTMNSFCD